MGHRVLGKQLEVSPPKGVRCEDILPRIPALRYMVWQTYRYHPRFARHTELVQVRQELSQQFGTVSSVPVVPGRVHRTCVFYCGGAFFTLIISCTTIFVIAS